MRPARPRRTASSRWSSTPRRSNDDCGLLGFDHGISTAANGTVTSGGLSVTVTGYDSPTGFVDWSSDLPIHGVYVKGGPSGGNLFAYAAGDTVDQDLHRPQKSDGYHGVSHVAFCWNDAPPAPDVVVEKANNPAGTSRTGPRSPTPSGSATGAPAPRPRQRSPTGSRPACRSSPRARGARRHPVW